MSSIWASIDCSHPTSFIGRNSEMCKPNWISPSKQARKQVMLIYMFVYLRKT